MRCNSDNSTVAVILLHIHQRALYIRNKNPYATKDLSLLCAMQQRLFHSGAVIRLFIRKRAQYVRQKKSVDHKRHHSLLYAMQQGKFYSFCHSVIYLQKHPIHPPKKKQFFWYIYKSTLYIRQTKLLFFLCICKNAVYKTYTCTSAKNKTVCMSAKTHYNPPKKKNMSQKSPVYPHKSLNMRCINDNSISQKSRIYPQKSPVYLQKNPICLNPYIAKEPFISAKEPQYAMHQRQLHSGCTFAKADDISAKEPYISAKEPYIFAKELQYAKHQRQLHRVVGCNFAKADDIPAKKPNM